MRFLECLENRHIKVARLSALSTGRLYPPGNSLGNHFCERLNRLEGYITVGRIMLMKNRNNPIGKRTCDLLACIAVSQATVPPRTPNKWLRERKYYYPRSFYFIRKEALAILIRKCRQRYPLKISIKNSYFTPDAVTMLNYVTV